MRLLVWATPVGLNGPWMVKEEIRRIRSCPPPGILRFEPAVGLGESTGEERDAHLVLPGLDLETNILEPFVDRVGLRDAVLVDRLLIGIAADRGPVDLAAIDGDDDRVLELHIIDPQGLGHVGDVNHIFAVGRKFVLDHQAAARSERQAFDMTLGRAVALIDIGGAAGMGLRIADRHRRHGMGRRDILLEEGRRDLQDRRHVVVAVFGIVPRQQRLGVHLDAEKITDRIGIFGAVEPVQRDMAGIGPLRRFDLVEIARERGGEGAKSPCAADGDCPAAA